MQPDSLLKAIGPEERVLCQAKCTSYKDFFSRSNVDLAVCQEKVLLLKGDKVSWESGRRDIQALSVSTLSEEFVLHLKDTPDLRLASDARHLLIEALLSPKGLLNVFFLEHKSLDKFVTSKKDLKKGVTKMPRQGLQNLDLASWQQYLRNLQTGQTGTFECLFKADNDCPKHIRDFRVELVIGKGSVSTIYLVSWGERKYALKIISKDLLLSSHGPEKTQQIIESLRSFQQDKYLARLEFCYQSESRLYFLSKFYRRGDLFSHLQRVKTVEEHTAKLFFCQTAIALHTLHQQGLIYSDLKPENIMLDDQGAVVLTDFGMGRLLRQEVQGGTVVATPEYVPPEFYQGQGPSQASDYYQLGLLLYEMLFGMLPFYHQDPDIMKALIQQFPLVLPKDRPVKEGCHALLHALLSKNPDDRPSSFQALQDNPWVPASFWQEVQERVYGADLPSLPDDPLQHFDPEITALPTIDFCFL